ncbi:MAG: hypothetical protein LBM61_07475, partial [Prevotellaceae bacterium]|nr:hypothetical protein [Prevotellaceae bacterium]
MRTYKCNKLVKAEPMDKHEAIRLGYLRFNDDEAKSNELNGENEEGYHIFHEDGYNAVGYHSWSPEKIFEHGYSHIGIMDGTPDWEVRLWVEHTELCERLEKL